jgi:hypothetical protein
MFHMMIGVPSSATASRQDVASLIQCSVRVISPEVKLPEREANHPAPPVAEIRNALSLTSIFRTSSWLGDRHRDTAFIKLFEMSVSLEIRNKEHAESHRDVCICLCVCLHARVR